MSELDELALLLHSKTMEGKLQWRLEGETRIISKQGKNIIEIAEVRRPDIYSLTLRNDDGLVLASERFHAVSHSSGVLRDVFAKARRSSLRVDEALTDVKQRLMAL